MTISNAFRVVCALSALAAAVPAAASDVSYDKLQLRQAQAAPAEHRLYVATADAKSCSCPEKRSGDDVKTDAPRARENPAPARAGSQERPTTGINRR
jgi:hypothetical protein